MPSSVNTYMHAVRGLSRFAHIDGPDPQRPGRLRPAPRIHHRRVPHPRAGPACRGQRTEGPLVLRPVSGRPIERHDAYRMVLRIAKAAGIPRHISPHSLRHAAITNALDAGVPLRDAQILARHADPRTTEHYDRARGNDRHGVHFLTAYVAGV
jgi:integrase/recombinase XerD